MMSRYRLTSSLLVFLYFLSLYFSLPFLPVTSSSFDPYNELQLPRSATAKQIKKAYTSQAKKFHPDKNKSPQAETKFLQIANAYEILSDPQKKQEYDTYG